MGLGAGGRDRTGTGLLGPRDFKSLASAYSATPAIRLAKQLPTGVLTSPPCCDVPKRARLACRLAAALVETCLASLGYDTANTAGTLTSRSEGVKQVRGSDG